jgi:hypothetical protein
MITSKDLEKIPVFADVEEQERRRLARRAAGLYLEPGDWLIREGEEPRFFVVLEGELEAVKYIVGQRRVLGRSLPVSSLVKRRSSWVLPASSPYALLQNAASLASSASNCRRSSAIVHPPGQSFSRP